MAALLEVDATPAADTESVEDVQDALPHVFLEPAPFEFLPARRRRFGTWNGGSAAFHWVSASYSLSVVRPANFQSLTALAIIVFAAGSSFK